VHEQLGPHTHVAAVTQPAAHEQDLEEQLHTGPQLQAEPSLEQQEGALEDGAALCGQLAHVQFPPQVQDDALVHPTTQEHAAASPQQLWEADILPVSKFYLQGICA